MGEVEAWSFGERTNFFAWDDCCVGSDFGTDFVGKIGGGDDVEEMPVDEEGGVN